MNDKEVMVCVVCGSDRIEERRIVKFKVNDPEHYTENWFVDYDCPICSDVTEIIEKGLFKKKNKV